MALAVSDFTLTKKLSLTHDVYELVFEASESLEYKVGQYIMFHLPSGLKRAYSIAWSDGKTFQFVIKRLEDGKGGSKEICDLEVGSVVKWMGPIGHFVLSDSPSESCLIGTGTGFAPLYAMILALSEKSMSHRTHFVFGVREAKDLFYLDILDSLSKKHSNFTYDLYLSREEKEGMKNGYVTDVITEDAAKAFKTFYLCGSPAMVKDSREKLEALGVAKESIKFEQY